MNKHLVAIIANVLQLADIEDYNEGVILPNNVLTSQLRIELNGHNHHCIPYIGSDECKHMASHLKAMADKLENYEFNVTGL